MAMFVLNPAGKPDFLVYDPFVNLFLIQSKKVNRKAGAKFRTMAPALYAINKKQTVL